MKVIQLFPTKKPTLLDKILEDHPEIQENRKELAREVKRLITEHLPSCEVIRLFPKKVGMGDMVSSMNITLGDWMDDEEG